LPPLKKIAYIRLSELLDEITIAGSRGELKSCKLSTGCALPALLLA